jgi:hypothetical protein
MSPESNKAYRAQWEDPATKDFNYVGTVSLPPFRGGRKGHVPHVGSLATPLHLTHEPTPSTAPVRVLAKKSVVGIRLGYNFAIATAVPRRVGPRPQRDLLAQMIGTKEAAERRRETKKQKQARKKSKNQEPQLQPPITEPLNNQETAQTKEKIQEEPQTKPPEHNETDEKIK